MTNEEFLQREKAATEHSNLVLVLRGAIADQCGVPPEMIQDTDKCDFLTENLAFDGRDECDFAMFLEDKLGIGIADRVAVRMPSPGGRRETSLPTLFGKREDCDTVAGWIRAVAPYIEEQMIAPSIGQPQRPASPGQLR
jgi:hypothetical protein